MKMEWDFKALSELIKNQIPESLGLEYKKSEALSKNDRHKNELSKDVSAFANSAGGVLIYGIEEEGHIPTKIDGGVDPEEISKEWLEQVINSRIQRKIDGIIIYQIPIGSEESNVVYVVVVPQSNRAPHQASDKKFYKRYNFLSEPMEEYEIRDVSRRNETPSLRILSENDGNSQMIEFDSNQGLKKFGIINPQLVLVNESDEPAFYAVVRISIDDSIDFIRSEAKITQQDNRKVITLVYGNRNPIPIFDGIADDRVNSSLKIWYPPQNVYRIQYDISAPKMRRKVGEFYIRFTQEGERWFWVLHDKESM